MSEQQQQAHISRVHLKGYKSIKDLEIDFKPGLNIVIGPNGSGKTNFLEFLNSMMKTQYKDFYASPFNSKILIKNSNFTRTLIEAEGILDFQMNTYRVNEKIFFNDKEVHKNTLNTSLNEYKVLADKDEFSSAEKWEYILEDCVFIRHGNQIDLILKKGINAILALYSNFLYSKDLNRSFQLLNIINVGDKINLSKKEWRTKFKITGQIIKLLSFYTPIKNIKVDNDAMRKLENGDEIIIENINLLFFVKKRWLQWNQLSDGTKRLFFIFVYLVHPNNHLTLLEEPELGIHPHQLSRLMDFLREQSETKQIIITTHSPQVLNELREDELDRIIVTRHEGERGTQMYHLSEEEKEFAKEYMSNGAFLSDYWVQSGFMQEEDIA